MEDNMIYLETARDPLTRDNMTLPPASEIRRLSMGLYGLWSWVARKVLLSRISIALESPQFAIIIWVGVTKAITAVEPDFSSESSDARSRSNDKNPLMMPFLTKDVSNSLSKLSF